MSHLEIMRQAALLGLKAPHTDKELAVGCIIADIAGKTIATGYSREDGDEKSHAEANALAKLPRAVDPKNLILFSTVEPCGTRLTQGATCTSLIIRSGIRHVLFAIYEPDHFVHQNGLEQMRAQGIRVEHLCDDDIFEKVAQANPHIAWKKP